MQETPQKLKVPTAKRVPRVHLLLLGASGVGKTALVNEWLKCGGDASACVGGAPGTGHSVGPDVAAVDVRLGPPFNAGVPLVVWDLPEEDVLAGSCFGPATSFCPDVCALVFDATDAESLRRACELRRRFLALLQGEQPRAPRPVSVASEAALLAASSPAATAASSAAPPPQQRRGHQRSISAVTAAANAARVPAFMAVGIAPAHPSSALPSALAVCSDLKQQHVYTVTLDGSDAIGVDAVFRQACALALERRYSTQSPGRHPPASGGDPTNLCNLL
eukprot:TRINITY_DN1578_c0_g1_i2.p1 TRINITY_DN1578_c0_g1~~TRINITY_DN1578_c0_g1_i2.p1  ORF type:complete len:286 (-),score=72.31 TRINITY_DN1578_c0_g1_i2:40-870(-)